MPGKNPYAGNRFKKYRQKHGMEAPSRAASDANMAAAHGVDAAGRSPGVSVARVPSSGRSASTPVVSARSAARSAARGRARREARKSSRKVAKQSSLNLKELERGIDRLKKKFEGSPAKALGSRAVEAAKGITTDSPVKALDREAYGGVKKGVGSDAASFVRELGGRPDLSKDRKVVKKYRGRKLVGRATVGQVTRAAAESNKGDKDGRGLGVEGRKGEKRLTTPEVRATRKKVKHARVKLSKSGGANPNVLKGLAPEERFPAKLAAKYGKKYNIKPALLMSLMRQESGFNPAATSSAAAQGLTQFIPSTAAAYGVKYGTSKKAQATQVEGAAKLLTANNFQSDPYGSLRHYTGGYSDAMYNDPVLQGQKDYKAVNRLKGGDPKKVKKARLLASKAQAEADRLGIKGPYGKPGKAAAQQTVKFAAIKNPSRKDKVALASAILDGRGGKGLKELGRKWGVNKAPKKSTRIKTSPSDAGTRGDWGGMEFILGKAAKGIDVSSRKRSASDPLSQSNPGSDHNEANANTYAVDLPATGDAGAAIASKMHKRLGLKEPLKTGTYDWYTSKKYPGTRYQVLWQVEGHFDHVHVGGEKTDDSGTLTAGKLSPMQAAKQAKAASGSDAGPTSSGSRAQGSGSAVTPAASSASDSSGSRAGGKRGGRGKRGEDVLDVLAELGYRVTPEGVTGGASTTMPKADIAALKKKYGVGV